MRFIKKYDERKGKERAEEVTGGSPEEEWRGGGAGGATGPGVTGPPPEGMIEGTVLTLTLTLTLALTLALNLALTRTRTRTLTLTLTLTRIGRAAWSSTSGPSS